MVVEGTPSVALEIGDHHAEATYRNGSGTNTIEFGYDVQVHDRDVDGFALPAGEGQSFHDGTIFSSRREIELVATYPGFASQQAHRIAGQVYVTEVSMGSEPGDDDTYEPGDVILVLVRFDDEVTVAGTPRLSLNLGGSTVAADFQRVHNPGDGALPSTGEALAFAYTVQDGDEDDNGITVEANSLNLHGGSILDTAGDDVLLRHNAATFHGHLVGVVPPVPIAAWTSADGQLVDDDGNALMHFEEQAVSNRSTLSAEAQELLPALSAYSLTIAEGETDSYSVVLGSRPDEDIVVTLSISPSGQLTPHAGELTFTPENWDSPQTVTLTAGTDDDALNFWQEILHTSDVEGFVVGHLKALIEDR